MDQKYKSMLDLPTSPDDYPYGYEQTAQPNEVELQRYYELHPHMTDIPVLHSGLPDFEGFIPDDLLIEELDEFYMDPGEVEESRKRFGIIEAPQQGIMREVTPEGLYMWNLARQIMGYEV